MRRNNGIGEEPAPGQREVCRGSGEESLQRVHSGSPVSLDIGGTGHCRGLEGQATTPLFRILEARVRILVFTEKWESNERFYPVCVCVCVCR